MTSKLNDYEKAVAGAIISVDTIWGGDVNCRSGTGRVIADSYFSWKELPECYAGPEADALRQSGGVSAKHPDRDAVRAYIRRFSPPRYIEQVLEHARGFDPLRRQMVEALAGALSMQLDLALERIGDGPPVPYERCVVAAMGQPAKAADTRHDLQRVRELLGELGENVGTGSDALMHAVDAYRKRTWVGHEGISKASARVIAELEQLVQRNVVPLLPEPMRQVPRSNVAFQEIKDAWFSGSMNYLGRQQLPNGEPAYEAEYEINAKIEKSRVEFTHLVAHEVVPGHVMTFALMQNLYHRGLAGFESTILTMNTRHSALFEGIANAGLLLAHGARTIEDLPADLQLGMLLSQLEDAAKNNASYFTYVEQMPAAEIKRRLRAECLATPERADKLTDAWAQHPLMGRAYMPSYRFGTELVLRLIREHGPARMIPVFYGAHGLVDCVTINRVVASLH